MKFSILTTCLLLLVSRAGAQTKENLRLEKAAEAEVIVFFGQNFEGDGIFYALDRSSSTRNGELALEKQEVVKNLNAFSDDVQFGIVFYDRSIQKHPANSRPAVASPEAKSAAIAFVMSRQSGSGTCAGLGVIECIRFANASTAKRNVIIYIGDGCTTCPGHDARQYARQALAEISAMNFKRHQINSILVGNEGNCDYWAKPLADMNGGTYSRIGDGPTIARFVRGDMDANGLQDLSDPVYLLSHMFLGTAAPPCEKGADPDDNGKLETTDAIYSLHYLFLGGAPPAAPFSNCGEDPTDDELTCLSSPACAG